MSKKNKLAKGGAIVRPLLANGDRPKYTVFYDMATQVLVLEFLSELKAPKVNTLEGLVKTLKEEKRTPTAEDLLAIATSNIGNDTPTFTQFLGRMNDSGLPPLDVMATLMAVSVGTKRELTADDVRHCILSTIDNGRLAIAVHQSAPESTRIDDEGWEKINNAKEVDELNAAFSDAISQN